MISVPSLTFDRLASLAYEKGYSTHGNIGLTSGSFENRLRQITEKHLGESASDVALTKFFDALYAVDLYLTQACSEGSDPAWRRFDSIYRTFITDFAKFISHSTDVGKDLASELIASLFLPARGGQSRIATFDGRQSLATWLRAVTSHLAFNRRALKWNSIEHLTRTADVADATSITTIEAVVRRHRYQAKIDDCLRDACACLSDRERLMVLLRYDEEFRVIEIAKCLMLHPSQVTRGLRSAQSKLHNATVSLLTQRYHLSPAEIQECVTEVLENPSHSPLRFLRQSAKAASVSH